MSLKKSLVLGLALFGCGGPGVDPPASRFHYRIDTQLAHPASQNGRPLEAVQDADGRTSLFITDEMILNTSDAAVATRVAAELGGAVVRSDVVPEPPDRLKLQLDAQYRAPTQFLLKIDPERADLSTFEHDAEQANLLGESAISSVAGAKTLALITHQRARGLQVSPNFVAIAHLVTSSQEHPSGAGFQDAYAMTPYLTTGSRSSVVPAWQLIQAVGGFSRVNVAIIDDGFWFDESGKPMSSQSPWVSDLPESPVQYDFGRDRYVASGPGRNHCSGGGACPWHGNGSAGTAVGAMNNRYGGAGTGALVADPFIFASEFTWDQVSRAIRTAVAWRASVISMSFAAECDNVFCDGYYEFNLYPALRNARDNNVVAVAAAGNDGQSTHSVPCKGDAVICVGALAAGSISAIDYSNFGPELDIWAPTDITVMPNPDSGGSTTIHNGTSASTPFVAGVVAMLKAYQPGLGSDQVKAILQRTACTDSPDPKVRHAINAYRALREVTGGLDATPDLTVIAPTTASLNRGVAVRTTTVDLEDGSPCCTVTWSPTPLVQAGGTASFSFTTVGDHVITATATDRHGNTASASATVRVSDAAPVVTVLRPAVTDTLFAGQSGQLSGSATDDNKGPGPAAGALPCTQLVWTSDNAADTQFPLRGCELATTFATAGVRTLRLTATDPQGVAASATVRITVAPAPVNYPPEVTVGALPAPDFADGLAWDHLITIASSATDPEGNTPLTYQWRVTTYRPASTTLVYASTVTVATTANLAWKPSATPGLFGDTVALGNACYNGQLVKLELVVTDSLGNATRRVIADPSLPGLPTLKIYRCILI